MEDGPDKITTPELEQAEVVPDKVISALRQFLRSEASGGVLLMLAAALAMLIANIGLYRDYHEILHGTLPWTADHQRRAILYKYNTGHMAWGGGGLRENQRREFLEELNEAQQATLLLPSHHSRRPKPSNNRER